MPRGALDVGGDSMSAASYWNQRRARDKARKSRPVLRPSTPQYELTEGRPGDHTVSSTNWKGRYVVRTFPMGQLQAAEAFVRAHNATIVWS